MTDESKRLKLVLITPFREWGAVFERALDAHDRAGHMVYGDYACSLTTVYRENYMDFDDFAAPEADALIARGTAVTALRQTSGIPVIQIPTTIDSLKRSVSKAIELYRPRKIAAVGYNLKIYSMYGVDSIIGPELVVYNIDDAEENCARSGADLRRETEALIQKALHDGCDTFICGIYGYEYAKKCGLNAVPSDIGPQEAWYAIEDARHSAYVYRRQRVIAELYKNILNYSFEGILSFDRDFRLQTYNDAAVKLMLGPEHKSGARTAGALESELESAGIVKLARGKSPYIDMVVSYKSRHFAANIIPVTAADEFGGCTVMLQDVTRIQTLEGKIRGKIYARGHVAKYHFEDIRGQSPAIRGVVVAAKDYAHTHLNILIVGETGTGKEIFAQSIHNESPRKKGPFVALNCAALSENLLESELFGYVDGAFTGAVKGGKPGYFELAHNGTIFLDEISEIPPRVQSKLLRAVQEREIVRLGDDKVTYVDVRIVCATNRDLEALVSQGDFREDLYYRLDVLRISLPPLSERSEDIPILAGLFFDEYAAKSGKPLDIDAAACRRLQQAPWRGNIRQLRNVCERAAIIAENGRVTEEVISSALFARRGTTTAEAVNPAAAGSGRDELAECERRLLSEALEAAGGNRAKAAQRLRMSRSTLYRKLEKYKR